MFSGIWMFGGTRCFPIVATDWLSGVEGGNGVDDGLLLVFA
jgi:hypothetical protein